jgi:hypothetical protein
MWLSAGKKGKPQVVWRSKNPKTGVSDILMLLFFPDSNWPDKGTIIPGSCNSPGREGDLTGSAAILPDDSTRLK